ncbi:signal transduction histidine kinase/ActR/RegA family two-component response regulator [Janthinobacterium sp. CG_23.3]|uniref:hybrid sensor histidine kinase/response regulator n=1 Tax=Janthinobacterium sp. CG_23.3 TaxID=3349634 RepID=UPI0038D3B870
MLKAKEDLEMRSEQLATSLATTVATLESTTDGIAAVDAALRITAFNRRFVAMLGLAPELMLAGDYARVMAAVSAQFAAPQAFLARVREIDASSLPESYDLLELADGRAFERYSKVQYVNGAEQGRVWSFRDITAWRRTEAALRDETSILERLNETGAMLASKLNVEELLQAVVDATTELSGAQFGAFCYISRDERGEVDTRCKLAGPAPNPFARFGRPGAAGLFQATLDGHAAIRHDDVGAAWHDGAPAPLRAYLAVPVLSRLGDVLGGLCFGHAAAAVFTARTERLIVAVAAQAAVAIDNARLYAAAQQSARERELLLASERAARSEAERLSAVKDEFLTTLSHELRTPLGAILGWSQILRAGPKSQSDLMRGLETIERNARLQARLVEDLLDMGRISSGKVRLDVQPVELLGVIHAAIDTVRPAAHAKGIGLKLLLDPSAGAVSGDPNRLQQVLWNLLTNAIKFTPKNGEVQLLLERVNSHIELSVADTGAGIAPEFLAHVFDRFRQADGSTTRHYGGLGLGLSIVKSLVELHGGTVQARSAGSGLGATFTVCLPVMALRRSLYSGGRVQPGTEISPAPPFAPANLSGIKVLVVDDEPDTRDLVRRLLEECHAEVVTAASAADTLALLERERPHVLISDIGMPDVDGYELLRRVRALGAERGGKVPAIALTAFARSEDRTRALRAGYLAHVAKPVEPGELIATVASVADRAGP